MELSHIINQYILEKKYVDKISKFLIKSNEESDNEYNKKLERLKKILSEVKYSHFFLKYLHYVGYVPISNEWKRGDPIHKTPKSHMIHASYFRVMPKSCFRIRDKHIGTIRPDIFINETNILTNTVDNKIGPLRKFYTMIRPFGYDFQDVIEIDGMIFKLFDLWNPIYLNEKNGSGPEPIIINGITTKPLSNKTYTILYKSYIKNIKPSV
jgi:hypothetical protein